MSKDYTLEELQEISEQAYADVDCPECGYSARVEPDCDDVCPECNKGRLVSPLVELGYI